MLSWLMCAALLVDPRASRGEVSGGVSAETRGGFAPPQAGAPSGPAFLLLLVPNFDVRVRHRRRGVLSFGVAPRILFRVPNLLRVTRPIFLGQASLAYAVPLDRRWDLFVGTNTSVGEIDYTAANLLFNARQPDLAASNVLAFAIGDARIAFTGLLARRHRLTIAPNLGYRKSLNAEVPETDPTMPTVRPRTYPNQLAGNLALSYGYIATRKDEVQVLTYNGVTKFDPGATFLTNDARLGWVHQIDRRVTSQLDAGVLTALRIQPDESLTAAQRQPPLRTVLPVGSARIGGRLRSRARYTLDGTIGASVTGYFDAVRGTLAPRAGGTITLNADLPPRWSVGLNSSVFTAATASPLPFIPTRDGGSVPQTESAVLNQIPIRYQIDDNMQVEFGAIANFRMPHFAAGTTQGTQTEVWGYVAFRIAGGTARGRREVAQRRVGTGQGAATGSGGAGPR
jgi:hypothetical protein